MAHPVFATGPFVHQIDPIVASIAGMHLWWYGLAYSSGFLLTHLWLRGIRRRLRFSIGQVYDLSLLVAAGVVAGARFVEVAVYEWPFYRDHLRLVVAVWLGGMSTHGVLLGAVVGTWLFCRVYGVSFLRVADELAVPGALIMALARLGNFVDGQIVGSLTDAWWGVKFPDADGFRHPVVLYDGLKNLLLVPLLLLVRRQAPPRGVVTGLFLFLYAFLRIFVDVFRQYPTTLFGLATGQSLNLAMATVGAGLLGWSLRRGRRADDPADEARDRLGARRDASRLWPRRLLFAALVVLSSVMPSDWTQDVPGRYGSRHPGLEHSRLYPPIPRVPP